MTLACASDTYTYFTLVVARRLRPNRPLGHCLNLRNIPSCDTWFGGAWIIGISRANMQSKERNIEDDWGTIWHRTQFGTVPNLAPDPIWHRTNLAPRVQKSQFGTGPNLAPESIWHHAKGIHFITLYSRNMKVICNKYNFAILRNLFESFFKSSLQVKPQDMYPPQILAIKVQYWESCTQYPLQMFPPLLGPQGPPDTKLPLPSSKVG